MLYYNDSFLSLEEFNQKVTSEIQNIWSIMKGRDFFRFGYPDVTPFEAVATYMAIKKPDLADKYLAELKVKTERDIEQGRTKESFENTLNKAFMTAMVSSRVVENVLNEKSRFDAAKLLLKNGADLNALVEVTENFVNYDIDESISIDNVDGHTHTENIKTTPYLRVVELYGINDHRLKFLLENGANVGAIDERNFGVNECRMLYAKSQHTQTKTRSQIVDEYLKLDTVKTAAGWWTQNCDNDMRAKLEDPLKNLIAKEMSTFRFGYGVAKITQKGVLSEIVSNNDLRKCFPNSSMIVTEKDVIVDGVKLPIIDRKMDKF